MSAKWIPDIFEYLDYRKFLADYYTQAKENNRAFSYRYFSRKAGYASPNFLKLVIDGQRNISADSIERFARALKLSSAQSRFFANLVAFNQAATGEEKNQAFERVAASRRFRQARKLDRDFYVYLSHWYYPAIREMVGRRDFVEDPEWIASQLLPSIQPAQSCAMPSAGSIGNYHRQMLTRAAESIELVKSENRDISALTVSISTDTVAELKDRIHDFRELLIDLCDRDESPDAVYQINLQLFPLTKTRKDDS